MITDRIPTIEEIISLKENNTIVAIPKLYDLDAIWLSKSYITGQCITCRIRKGLWIRVDNGILVNVRPGFPATHEILKVKGFVNSHFVIFAQHLMTFEIQIIKI